MFALLRNYLSVESSALVSWHRPVLRLDHTRLFTSSPTRCKFRRPDPTDAELLEMSSDRRRYYLNRHDPVFHSKRIEALKPYNAKLKQRRKDDPEFKQQMVAYWKASDRVKRLSKANRDRDAFRKWLISMPERQRNAYDWKTHLPIVFPESQRMTCNVCSAYSYKAKLWWQRLDNNSAPDASDAKWWTCHSCYMEQEMTNILPRGLENHVIGSGKRWPLP